MNRIDSQIDELLALLETMEQRQAQKEAERLDALRLKDLERAKGCEE